MWGGGSRERRIELCAIGDVCFPIREGHHSHAKSQK